MARVQYTFTFTNAQPGATVNFGDVPVFSSATDSSADGPRLVLDSDNTVTVWSGAATLTAATVDGRGEPLAATATRSTATVTTDDGTAGTSPFASGTSVPVPVDGDEGKVLTVSDPYTDGYELAAPTSGGGGLPIPGPNSAAQFTLVDLSAGLPAASLALQFDEPAGWIDDLDPAFGVSVDGTRLYVRSDAWYLANIAIDVEVTDGDTWPLLQFTGDWGLQPAELRGTLRSGDVGGGHRLFAFRATLLDALPDGYPSGPGDVGALGLTINCNGTGSIEAVSGAGVLLTTLAS